MRRDGLLMEAIDTTTIDWRMGNEEPRRPFFLWYWALLNRQHSGRRRVGNYFSGDQEV